jgi:hypothetical protein
VNDYIYESGTGDFYFLSLAGNPKLKKITGVRLDMPTLKHVTGNYYTDKNGLYLLGGYTALENNATATYEESVQLESSNGSSIEPVVKRHYFIYGKSVYSPLQHYNNNRKLPLNVNEMKEFEINKHDQVYFLADAMHTYETKQNRAYSHNEADVSSFNERYDKEFFRKNVHKWQIITEGDINFIEKDNGKTLYFPSEKMPFEGETQNHVLIKTPAGFYLFDEGDAESLTKVNKVFWRNFDTKKYEELEADKYRPVGEFLTVYKNRVYSYDCMPVKEEIDGQSLRFLTQHDEKSNYVTDGKLLIYVGEGGGYSYDDSSGEAVAILGERLATGVDFPTLKIITADILIDKSYIYSGNNSGITVIPINELGLDIRIFTE